jgi:hypothetical protein
MTRWTRATHRPRREPGRVVRASEVGSFAYCARAWWLGAVQGLCPQDTRPLQAGQAAHERHGQRVLLGNALARLAWLLLALAGLVGVGWAMQALGG